MQAVAVDYVIPLYVVWLTGMTYLIHVVELHDRDFELIVWCWKPFRCTHRFRWNWNMKDSLIETFAVLSYSKLAIVSIRLLKHICVQCEWGEGGAQFLLRWN